MDAASNASIAATQGWLGRFGSGIDRLARTCAYYGGGGHMALRANAMCVRPLKLGTTGDLKGDSQTGASLPSRRRWLGMVRSTFVPRQPPGRSPLLSGSTLGYDALDHLSATRTASGD